MNQLNDLLNQLNLANDGGKTINRVQNLMNSDKGKNMAKQLDRQTMMQISQIAEAAKRGDKMQTEQELKKLLSTKQGAELTKMLQGMLGQR